MKATLHYWATPAQPDAQHEAEDIRLTVFLPFMPTAGMKLKVTPDGDYLKVAEVFWDISSPDEVEVVFEEPLDLLPEWEQMKEQGWRIL